MIIPMRRFLTLLFLLAAVPVGAVALAVLIAGWVTVAVLSITPLVIPALIGFRMAVGATVRVDAWLANRLLGTAAQPSLTSPGAAGFWRRGGNVLQDRAFWRQQAYLLTRLTLGFGVAVAEWTLLAASVGLIAMPIWYRWSDTWEVDSLGRAFVCVPIGVAGLAIALALLGPLARWSRSLVVALLSGERVSAPLSRRRIALRPNVFAYLIVTVPLVIIWAITGAGYFWPEWILIALGLPLAILIVVATMRGLAAHAALLVSFAAFFTVVWAVTGRGYFWPAWPILFITLSFVAAAWVSQAAARRRIAQLEETRAGAVDQQESELERIERDLHDGAQARLVALGMSIGLAEQKLASDPAAAQALLAEARQGTREALAELRGLARGIHPPVLADRGLEAAIGALAHRTPLRVNVSVDVPERPARPLETTAYFVVAEALANTGKHADAEQVDIVVRTEDGSLVVEVLDNGGGGANADGEGLRGLTKRVQAVDGSLEVTSPLGGPTMIRAVIPCE
jgi:signal transduction histidine kinase